MKSVLILSKWNDSGSVAVAVEQLRARGLRSVLVSPFPVDRDRDRDRDKCDDHILMDWDSGDPSTLITQLDRRDIVPIAVINIFEALVPWQAAIAAHYDLPGAGAGLDVLASKTLVRKHMRTLGLSAVRFSGAPEEVDFFPAIVKPARGTSSSWLVRRVDNPAELLAYQRHLAERGLADTELIIEEYLPGTEFYLDGPVVGGRFHPVLTAEKLDHDDTRHHDAGLNVHPPQHDHVRDGVRALSETIDTLCADLRLDQLWLHIEGRTTVDGRTELIEINPRPGGGMVPTAIRELSGVDPIEAVIAMSLGEFSVTPQRPNRPRDRAVIGWVDVEADELGTVQISTREDDLRTLPGFVGAEILNGYQITSLEKENFFLCFAIAADSLSQLRTRAETVLSKVDYRIAAQLEAPPV